MNMKLLGMVGILLCVTLTGCVRTSTQRSVDADSAHDKRVDLGMQYLSVDKRDNARRQFSRALEYDPKSAEAWHGIAMVHEAHGEMEPAAKAFRKALKYSDKSNYAGIAVSYGKYLMNLQETEQACQYFEDAAHDYDYRRRAEALYMAGKCAAASGDMVRAKSAYEHSLNLEEQHPAAMLALAEIYFQEGNYARAKRLLDRFTKVSRPTAQSLWLGIRIERVFGNKDKEASYVLALKNMYPYSKEYLEYKKLK